MFDDSFTYSRGAGGDRGMSLRARPAQVTVAAPPRAVTDWAPSYAGTSVASVGLSPSEPFPTPPGSPGIQALPRLVPQLPHLQRSVTPPAFPPPSFGLSAPLRVTLPAPCQPPHGQGQGQGQNRAPQLTTADLTPFLTAPPGSQTQGPLHGQVPILGLTVNEPDHFQQMDDEEVGVVGVGRFGVGAGGGGRRGDAGLLHPTPPPHPPQLFLGLPLFENLTPRTTSVLGEGDAANFDDLDLPAALSVTNTPCNTPTATVNI